MDQDNSLQHPGFNDTQTAESTPRPQLPIVDSLLTLSNRFGLLLTRTRSSIWVYGASQKPFDIARPLIYQLQKRLPKYRWVFISPAQSTLNWLKKRYIDEFVLPSPASLNAERFFQFTDPCLILVIGSVQGLSKKLFIHAAKKQIPIIYLEVDQSNVTKISDYSLNNSIKNDRQLFCVAHPETSRALQNAGVTESAILLSNSLQDSSINTTLIDTAEPQLTATLTDHLAALTPFFPTVAKVNVERKDLHVPTMRDRVGQSKLWKSTAAFLTKRRLDSVAALRNRLGNPDTILCLGNGPSSEDPQILSLRHDALFRVNYVWQERGILLNPDVVFVGAPETLYKVRPCIYGIATVFKEYGMLLRRLWSCGIEPMEYFTVERLIAAANPNLHEEKLTNGAYMIMSAASLQPKRLIIGGIDLYLHPQGRYPGNLHANNNYAPVHSRNTELQVIADSLRDYQHELIIVGDILRDSLQQLGIKC